MQLYRLEAKGLECSFAKKRPMGPGGQQTERESAVRSYKKEGQAHTGLYWWERKQIEGSEPSPLLL